jgi:DNA-binding transcriptional ArsR family regulator
MIFKALSSKTRIEMVKLLMQSDYHVSGLARALGISVPVAAKHVRILEDAELVESKIFGRTHVLSVNREKLYEAMEAFGEEYGIEVQKGASILEVLKQVAGVGTNKIGGKEFLVSIDDEEGFYVYEVEGELPDTPINEYKMEKDGEIEIKRLVPVLKKRVKVKINDDAVNFP